MLKHLLLISFVGITSFCYSNNISVTNVTLTGQNTTSDFTLVQFDISWDNSWRTSTYESNWDAAWVFVKWRLKTRTTWNHATINTTGHTAPTGATITTPTDGKGVFMYKDANGIGTNIWTTAQLRWNYGVDNLLDGDRVEVCVFAIEMVYIPQGSYYLGDGSTDNGQFEQETFGTPAFILTENQITLGGGMAGSLGNNNTTGMFTVDDFDDVTTQTLPANFPKGYNAFYMMKYEITQEQYAEFLNKLTRTQQGNRMVSTTVGDFMSDVAGNVTPQYRNGVKLMSDPGGSSPRVYGNDLNDNDIAAEADDGQNIACNYLSWADLAAYLDWSGLRPMTELEFEKACRGSNLSAVADEYAWGNTTITVATGITNSGLTNETASNAGANCVSNISGTNGPLRVGNFAQTTNRQNSGASYYGVMELSGNLEERTISVGNATGRTFTGTHGDGNMDAPGDADAANWPGTSATGVGRRGGDFDASNFILRVSDRYLASSFISVRNYRNGGRGVRIAP